MIKEKLLLFLLLCTLHQIYTSMFHDIFLGLLLIYVYIYSKIQKIARKNLQSKKTLPLSTYFLSSLQD